MPEPVREVHGVAAPLVADDVDTDQIIPAQFLKVIEKKGLGRYLFYQWRYDGSGKLTGTFVLDRPEFRGAMVLVAGKNFGVGSSRENAVWALLDMGVKCIVAASFGDIFYNNSAKNGLLCVRLPDETLLRLRDRSKAAGLEVAIDLQGQTVTYNDTTVRFEIEPHIKGRLLSGMDDIAVTTSKYEREIWDYESRAPAYLNPRSSAQR